MALPKLLVRRTFRKRLFGYDCGAVDEYVAEVVAASHELADEIERLRSSADPVDRASREVAAILRTFAEAVAAEYDRSERRSGEVLDLAQHEAEALRREAERLKEEAAITLDEARRRASTLAEEATVEAERRLAVTFADAFRHFDEVRTRRDDATRVIGEAIVQLEQAMSRLAELPSAPNLFAPALSRAPHETTFGSPS